MIDAAPEDILKNEIETRGEERRHNFVQRDAYNRALECIDEIHVLVENYKHDRERAMDDFMAEVAHELYRFCGVRNV